MECCGEAVGGSSGSRGTRRCGRAGERAGEPGRGFKEGFGRLITMAAASSVIMRHLSVFFSNFEAGRHDEGDAQLLFMVVPEYLDALGFLSCRGVMRGVGVV